MDLRECFLLSGVFYLTLIPVGFKASLRVGSSTSKLAVLQVNLRNIAPAQLFVSITAIHKRFICGRFYLRFTAGRLRNEESASNGI